MTSIDIENIFSNNEMINSSISGVNNQMKVEGQKRVYALWKRLTAKADNYSKEIGDIVSPVEGPAKMEQLSDTDFF